MTESMRYFLFNYSHPDGFGSFPFALKEFPSNQLLRGHASKQASIDISGISILGFNEFNNEQDFKAYIGEGKD